MLKLTPILLAVLYAVAMYLFSAWRTARQLDAQSTPLADAPLRRLCMQMAAATGLPEIRVHVYEVARRMIDFSGQNAIRVVLGGVLNRILPGLGGWLAGFVATLLAARLSRQDEYEADAYASALLVKAGIGLAPQKSLFAKLEGLTGMGGAMPAWLMSHPKSAERIKAIEARERQWGLASAHPLPER
ncbi:MAG: peptidase M48 [Alphaproteobacteria bacterium HGW-Alphaproteobacteria-2]|nr:MAG: peptidase M48 [Alphaproteobacteria bacterium HGW-Alphaproteobacteria-2]